MLPTSRPAIKQIDLHPFNHDASYSNNQQQYDATFWGIYESWPVEEAIAPVAVAA